MTGQASREHLFLHWSRKFKDLCTVKFIDGRTIIFLQSYEVIKKFFVQHADYFSNRPKQLWLDHYIYKGKGNNYYFTLFNIYLLLNI